MPARRIAAFQAVLIRRIGRALKGKTTPSGFSLIKGARRGPGSGGEWDLASLPARGFRVSDEEHATVEIDVLRALGEEFAPAHSRIECRDDEVAQVRRGRIHELRFFGKTQDRPWLPPLLGEPDAGDGVCGKEAFVNPPIKEMAKDFDIAVERSFGERLLLVPRGPIFPDRGLRDIADGPLADMRQEHFEPVEMG